MKTTFIYKVNDYAPAIGTIVTLETPDVAEMLSLCGFDWLFIDMEHGPLSPATTQHIIQAVGGDCSSIVRVPENSEVWIKKALDTGCDGVIVPQVKSAEDARLAVTATKFPPQGSRSVGIARAHGYGMSFTEYVAEVSSNVVDRLLRSRGYLLLASFDQLSVSELGSSPHQCHQVSPS
jgi:2-keto-3-deoxy-L-rhamnonate aldolase RhmA